MKMARCDVQYFTDFTARVVVALAMLVWALAFGGIAAAEIYADSAHGDTTYGVNRSTADCSKWPGQTCVGTTGSCAHCHDTYDDTFCGVSDLMLFAPNDNPTPTPQSDNFCYECHGSGTAQLVTNHTYSKNFGGGTATLTTIYDAFNPATGTTPSSHNLADVLSHAVGRGIGFTVSTNPCLVCHDHHASQQNYPVTPSGLGGVKTAIRRPADYASPPTNLWGDEDPISSGYNERMEDYTNKYQAPYYGSPGDPILGPFEPANDGTSDGSNLPNFFNFCNNQCHTVADVYSTEHGELTQIDWSTTGDRHGKYHEDPDGWGYNIAPYTNGETFNYVLSCTDCHETHGSENEWLLRTSVNGKDNIEITESGRWLDFCTACHVLDGCNCWHDGNGGDGVAPVCSSCHVHGANPPNGL